MCNKIASDNGTASTIWLRPRRIREYEICANDAVLIHFTLWKRDFIGVINNNTIVGTNVHVEMFVLILWLCVFCAENFGKSMRIHFICVLQNGNHSKIHARADAKHRINLEWPNYRPISLTCVCSKLMEHILVSQINRHFDRFSILTPLQHGFRAKRSCETQLVMFVQDLINTLARGLCHISRLQ